MRSWHAFLHERGATFAGDVVAGFGDAAAERSAARDTAVLCDLSPVAIVAVTGADAAAFLQGQLTSDVIALDDGMSQLSAWCSPKGRVVANFLLRRVATDRFEIALPAPLVASMVKRLRMYVLRARVEVADASDASIRIGLGGPAAAAGIAATIGVTPPLHHSTAIDGGTVIALRGNRFLLAASAERAPALWDTLVARARPAGFACWQWLAVRAAIPMVKPATQDAFIPQMLNLDALDAIAFGKGCYAGQEIVARTQYLGRLKERLALAHVDAEAPLEGARIFSPAFGDQPCGTVINAAAAPDGGADFLAVAQIAALEGDTLRLGAADGPAIARLPLPYGLPPSDERPGRRA